MELMKVKRNEQCFVTSHSKLCVRLLSLFCHKNILLNQYFNKIHDEKHVFKQPFC